MMIRGGRLKLLTLGWLIIMLLLPTGCWNAREIDKLAFVMGIALDEAPDGGVKVTVQMAKPEPHSKSPAGGGGENKEEPYWIASGTGKTYFEAIRNIATFSSKRVFWSHNKVVIISESLARRDIAEILDFFTRNPELRLRTWIAVTPGSAGELLQKGPSMGEDTASAIDKIFQQHVWTGKGYTAMIKDFLENYLDPAAYPIASRLIFKEDQRRPLPQLSGAAVFNDDKMAGWLDEQETRGLLWLKDTIANPVLVVPCPFDGQPLSIEITRAKIKYHSYIEGEQPGLDIKIEAAGALAEQSCNTNFADPETLKTLEAALAAAISEDVEAVIHAAQGEMELDFLGLSEILHRQHKAQWQQMVEQWPRLFKQAEISLQVDAVIPSVSLYARPLGALKDRHFGNSD